MKVIIALEDGRSAVAFIRDEDMALLEAEAAEVRKTAERMGEKTDYSAADELAYGIISGGIAALRERKKESLPAATGQAQEIKNINLYR